MTYPGADPGGALVATAPRVSKKTSKLARRLDPRAALWAKPILRSSLDVPLSISYHH